MEKKKVEYQLRLIGDEESLERNPDKSEEQGASPISSIKQSISTKQKLDPLLHLFGDIPNSLSSPDLDLGPESKIFFPKSANKWHSEKDDLEYQTTDDWTPKIYTCLKRHRKSVFRQNYFPSPQSRHGSILGQALLSRETEILVNLNLSWLIFSPNPILFPQPTTKRATEKTLLLNLESIIYIPFDPKLGLIDIRKINCTTKSDIIYYKRPFIQHFICQMSLLYEIIIWTNFEQEYSIELIEEAFDDLSLIDGLLHRSHCSLLGDKTIKESKILQNRERKNIIIVDHEISAWPFDQELLVPIEPFIGGARDEELPYLERILSQRAFRKSLEFVV